ncbi:hypothetical protein G4G28_21660 [Massilia sp. Dwa41.01b]|uniref:hypothetical protein n=1 Tax=unclassified Massilia TaxID=2609279 RepID=UPI0015FED1A4|nr:MULTISPECIES: hypothetical protein [unclassified Massilia]QNA90452.1 hypothetical protein G4G28_21660 [Massilia sp. Dwa41.01b]QNA97683.1 hypothetical protein G4G31_00745 [Massilia sp. Se16.2.3]
MKELFADAPTPGKGTRHQDAVMLASVLHLMSHYTARDERDRPCVRLASSIERHLCALARLPELDPVLRATCEQLCEKWASLVDEGMPRPAPKRNFLERIMGSRAGTV